MESLNRIVIKKHEINRAFFVLKLILDGWLLIQTRELLGKIKMVETVSNLVLDGWLLIPEYQETQLSCGAEAVSNLILDGWLLIHDELMQHLSEEERVSNLILDG